MGPAECLQGLQMRLVQGDPQAYATIIVDAGDLAVVLPQPVAQGLFTGEIETQAAHRQGPAPGQRQLSDSTASAAPP